MILQRLIFKSTKFLEILLILIRFHKIFIGFVFLGHPVSKACENKVTLKLTAQKQHSE